MSVINSSNQRQSRLLQPSSRLSFQTQPTQRISTNSTFQNASARSAALNNQAQGVKTPTTTMLANANHYQQQYSTNSNVSEALPNANTSGLPAPTRQSTPAVSNKQSEGYLIGGSASVVPSTVGSALRKRQSGITQLSGGTSSSLLRQTLNGLTPNPAEVRRSQSQKPSGNYQTFGLGNKQRFTLNPTATFAAQLKANYAKHDADDEEPDEIPPTKCIQSLPPLKSTNT